MTAASSATTTNIMLAIYEKKTNSIDLYRPLRQYISYTYSEREAVNLEDDLSTVKTLRSDIERIPDPSPTTRRDLLISYFKALCLIETRFPISPDRDHINTIQFTWFDAFKQKQKAVQQNIHLEKAAILFNLGAVYSQLGLSYDRTTVEGRRLASHAFIAAAGAFAYLRDNASTKASMGNSTTVDLSVECAGMLERLMLAQAQECVFENTIAKGSTPGVCSKISRQVGLYYEEALAALGAAPLKDHFEKAWIAHVQLKASLFYSEACYRYGLELHEKEEIAEEIARLKSGVSALTEAKKSSKGAPAQILDAISKLEVNLNRNLERAMKENERVYLMRVPSPSSLAALPAFSMVKSMQMNDVLDASKEKMFSSLVPDSSAKALSRYTEMVDEVIRTQAEKLQQGSELTRVRLKEMDLPDSILALEGNFSLPEDLKNEVEMVQASGGPAGLEAELQQLRDLRRVNQELLVQTEELLQKEAAEDAQFRSQFGTRWTRPQSSTLTKTLQERLNKFAANLKQAGESDARIERSVREHSALMSILNHRPIEAALPSLSRPIMSLDANEDAMVGALKQSLRQLETLGAQRAGLEDMLKEMKRKDDILPKLMTSTGSYEDLFRKEIAKYDHVCEEIAQNIEAQEQLLMQIQAQNEEFGAVFNLEDYKGSRERCYKQIQAALAKCKEIKDNFNEGLKFYVTLQDAINNIKQQCSDFVMTRNIQCREMMEDVQRKMAGFSFQERESAGPYPSVGQSRPRPSPQQITEHQSISHPPPQTPYYSRPAEQPMHGYGHPPPPYTAPQQPPPYHVPPSTAAPYPPPSSTAPYPPPNTQQRPPIGHEYGQPAYPGWRGPYYDAPAEQPGSLPRPPYTIPNPYHPHQSGYHKQ
ncbi:sarcoplasmic reticulum histidine-rich calcium-binding protein-like isoform 2 [Hibiscus syriacus]|uniref:Sarcoplasmic reticulum histidine-rich calcium-binding protein-like isoform 2 n=1 Tax=Hibiscus syriacus TaxID=106335 RepID=A0A6A2X1C3_HIBSY|nr:vacuolar-sorting protein BRO1-like [Hibiscus syriacus]XP_039040068.1 vacuolar-sorting protein BRO1-like [Hibiscus syriacus]KAE8668228.1 sarcoplasmic reticulum histidine-rich calcium-binding protein-like isoform 2 [Hibiscus syriacus]